jgi:hypothetical protein
MIIPSENKDLSWLKVEVIETIYLLDFHGGVTAKGGQ